MTALVVDDVAVMRFILIDTLVRACGISKENIREAENGEEAVEKYKELASTIVFLDITMSDMDGIEVVKKIIKIDPEATIVMHTSSSDEEDVRICLEAGAKAYLLKPPNPEKIAEVVEKVTGQNVRKK